MSEDNLLQLANIIEGAILAAGEPLNKAKLLGLFEKEEAPEAEQLQKAIEMIQERCEGRGFELLEVASGWRFQVRKEMAPWVNKLWDEKPQKYSRALLETLALIAYRQPLTRSDIEEVRGVAVSSHITKTLQERDWIKVVGHRDVPGRPSLFATTKTFLDYFNLKSLDELPTLGELKDIDSLNEALDFETKLREATGESLVGEGETAEAADSAADESVSIEASGDEVAENKVAENKVAENKVAENEVAESDDDESPKSQEDASSEDADLSNHQHQELVGDDEITADDAALIPEEDVQRPSGEELEGAFETEPEVLEAKYFEEPEEALEQDQRLNKAEAESKEYD